MTKVFNVMKKERKISNEGREKKRRGQRKERKVKRSK